MMNELRKYVVAMWRLVLALVLIVLTSPIFWAIDYDKLISFVKDWGITVVMVLSVVFGIVYWTVGHPLRAVFLTIFCVLMFMLEDPAGVLGQAEVKKGEQK